jgi:hypothetical protein
MNLRNEALLMLDKRGAVLDAARTVSELLRKHELRGAVIGGISVVLHGHIRTTRDVDVLIQQPLKDCKAAFEKAGMEFDARKREFLLDEVPVHLVPDDMVTPSPRKFVEIEEITTVTLADLISMKLHSGTKHAVRAQDIADVIGLIRENKLAGSFASKIDPPVRNEFRRLVKAVQKPK